MTLAEDVVALQQRLANAQREHSRAEGARDAAQAAYDSANAELRRDYGVSTVEEAAVRLAELRRELEATIADISAKLDQIGI